MKEMSLVSACIDFFGLKPGQDRMAFMRDAMRDDKEDFDEKMRLLKEWCDLQIHRRDTLDMHRQNRVLLARRDPDFQRFLAKCLP